MVHKPATAWLLGIFPREKPGPGTLPGRERDRGREMDGH